MSYWDNICSMQLKQEAKGLDTYGMRLEDNKNLTMTDRLEYLQEELIDGLMYIEHIKAATIDKDTLKECERLLWELQNGIPNKPYQKTKALQALIKYVKDDMNDKRRSS